LDVTQNETFDLAGPMGRLEAILMRPAQPERAAAVICHAHPQHGGIMHFKVLFRAAKALQEHGVAVLRFNFRGVGRSEGVYDHGIGEQDDVCAAVDEMARRFPGLPQVAGGFSFGSVMALIVGGGDPRVRALLAMGIPIVHVREPGAFLDTCRKPRLFIQGENDEYGDRARIDSLVAPLPEPKSLVVVPGSDHFFNGHLDEVQAAVSAWAAQEPWNAARV
jgi:alpha/beta superfamily hydrolase